MRRAIDESEVFVPAPTSRCLDCGRLTVYDGVLIPERVLGPCPLVGSRPVKANGKQAVIHHNFWAYRSMIESRVRFVTGKFPLSSFAIARSMAVASRYSSRIHPAAACRSLVWQTPRGG